MTPAALAASTACATIPSWKNGSVIWNMSSAITCTPWDTRFAIPAARVAAPTPVVKYMFVIPGAVS